MPVFESEKEFEETLMENTELLTEFFGDYFWDNQVSLPGYGIMDIVGVSCEGCNEENYPTYEFRVSVIELKIGSINTDNIKQICRYKTGLERIVERLRINNNKYKKACNFRD